MDTEQFETFLQSIGGLVDGRRDDKRLVYANICQCGDGWLQLIADLITELIAAGWNKEIRQIKEKFAGLSFYTNELPAGGPDIVHKYVKLSFETCEVCGSTEGARVRGSGWIKTLCDKHGS